MPFNQPAFRDVSRLALAQLEINRVNRLVEACKNCIPNIAADDVKKVEVATKLNAIAQRRINKTQINGSQQKNIEKIRETLEFCKETSKAGRPIVDAVLAEIITIAGGAHDDADWVKAQEKAIYKQAFEALMLVDERFKIDDTFGANQEAWTTEAYLPIASI